MKFNGKSKILGIVLVAAMIGLAAGYGVAVSVFSSPGSSNENVILSPERAKADPDSYSADLYNGHHTLIDTNGKVQGRVISVEMYVENEQDRFHFLVVPDLDYTYMLNDNNREKLGGGLMVELLYTDNFVAPKLHIGQHLEIQGPFVTDHQDNHEYNEIDPANAIIKIR